MNEKKFDTSSLAWEAYKILYDLEDCIVDDESAKRPFIKKKIGDNAYIKLSGETDFNFGEGWSNSIFPKYERLIKEIAAESSLNVQDKEKYVRMYKKQLDLCRELYRTVVNISLMPQTGNLQATKKGLGNDRIDVFIWALDCYYEETNHINLLANNSTYDNLGDLAKYLKSFSSVYEYCEQIYHINHLLVDDLIESGKQAIDEPFRIMNYMKLAYRFWNQKLQYFKAKTEELTQGLQNQIEEIDAKLQQFCILDKI